MAKSPTGKSVETLTHVEATRRNIPTAEYQSVLQREQEAPRGPRRSYSSGGHHLRRAATGEIVSAKVRGHPVQVAAASGTTLPTW